MGPDDLIRADPPYAFLASSAGHNPIVNDSLMYTLMVDNGVVSDKPVLQALRDNRVPYLLLEWDLTKQAEFEYGGRTWPIEVVQYLQRHYLCDAAQKRLYSWMMLIVCRRNSASVD